MAEHPGLKNLFNEVVSGKFQWERWGLLSVLSDYVLYYTQGDILEIGCGESSVYLSKLAEKYNRTCYHVEYSKSGVENMKNTKGYFGKNSKVFNMKSHDFFYDHKIWESGKTPSIALAFIDGDHDYHVVKEDFHSVWQNLVLDGYVFLHDTMPPSDAWKAMNKCGTVYKLREELEVQDRLGYMRVFTFPKSAFDVGLTMVRKWRTI